MCNYCKNYKDGKCKEHLRIHTLKEGCPKYRDNITLSPNSEGYTRVLSSSSIQPAPSKLIIKAAEVLIEERLVTDETEEIVVGEWVFKRVRD